MNLSTLVLTPHKLLMAPYHQLLEIQRPTPLGWDPTSFSLIHKAMHYSSSPCASELCSHLAFTSDLLSLKNSLFTSDICFCVCVF